MVFFLGGGGLLEVSGGGCQPPSAAIGLVLQVRDLGATRLAPEGRRGMFGIFGLRLPRVATLLFAGTILVAVCAAGILYVWSPKATLRITTGPAGGIAERFISAFIGVTTAAHPQIRFETVTVADLRASSKALEDHKVDIALVVTRNPSGSYQGRTVLPLEWAYQNARLVCRPDSDWLTPDRVESEPERLPEDDDLAPEARPSSASKPEQVTR